MKRSELRQIIREESSKVLKEASGNATEFIIDLYTGEVDVLPKEEFKDAIKGLKKVVSEGGITSYKGEEYIVVVLKKP